MCPFELSFSQGICPIGGFLGHIEVFSVFRNIHTVLHNGCINLHSQHDAEQFPSLQHLLFVDFFDGGRPGWWKVIPHRSALLWSVMLFVCLCCCLVTQLCSTFLGPHDCSPPDFSDGISQARISEWVSISYFRGSSWLRNHTHFSCKSPALQVDSLHLSHWKSC